jgi:hypothetical protein
MARIYEAPELAPVGDVQDVVLGVKDDGARDFTYLTSKDPISVLDVD